MIHPRFESTQSKSTMVSLTIHTCAVALILLLSKQIIPPASEIRPAANIAALISPFTPKSAALSMGGGGGAHQTDPATAGRIPKIAPQFVPPTLQITNLHPKLAMEMSIEAPPDAALLDRSLPTLGDPLSKFLNGSAGTGGPLGIGNGGKGTGIGDKQGPGVGAGDSLTGTIYQSGHGVTAPVPIHTPEPEFSDEARHAKHSGIVILRIVVDATGHARNIHVAQSLGMGLDEKAINAVTQWLFKPGTKDGKPVPVSASVEVHFQLL